MRINTALKYLFKPSSHALSSVLANVFTSGSSYSKKKYTSEKSISNAAQIGDLAIVTLKTVTKIKCNAYGFSLRNLVYMQEMVDSIHQLNIIKR